MKKHSLYILLTLFLSSCASIDKESHIKNERLLDRKKSESIQLDTVWQCRDYVYDDDIALELTRTNVAVGDVMMQALNEANEGNGASIEQLKNDKGARDALNELNDFYAGLIQLSGEEPEGAIYQRQGLNHRWEWGDGYVFVVEPGGMGYYYDFTNSEKGESVRSSDSFKCKRK